MCGLGDAGNIYVSSYYWFVQLPNLTSLLSFI